MSKVAEGFEDTITVTNDGRTIVDTRKLLEKPEVKAMIADISRKVRVQSRRSGKRSISVAR